VNTVSLNVEYRPIRVGFCVRDGDLASAMRAMEYAHTIWGGRFCPIIPIDNFNYAEQLVNSFKVDILFPIKKDTEIEKFLAKFQHLRWPFSHEEFWIEQNSGKSTQLLSVAHPFRHIATQTGRDTTARDPVVLLKWDKTDLLDSWLLAFVGAYAKEDSGQLPDYEKQFCEILNATIQTLEPNQNLPSNFFEFVTPNLITEFDLYLKMSTWFGRGSGIYVANGNDFIDLVNFWNFRANGENLIFYNTAASNRLDPVLQNFVLKSEKMQHGGENGLVVCGRDRSLLESLNLKNCHISEIPTGEWDYFNQSQPHFASSRTRSVLATVNDESLPPALSLSLPEKPFFDDTRLHNQHVMATVGSYLHNALSESDYLFPPPPIRLLNEFYARQFWFDPFQVRVNPDGVGFMVAATDEHLQLRAIKSFDVFEKIFAAVGIKIQRDRPGLIAQRLIKQMGGLQGCRVFKIRGVRDLIQKYQPNASFTHSNATKMIFDADFKEYESLHIKLRNHEKLSPNDVFQFLLESEVFRAGLELHCPNCELDFWKHIDECKTMLPCDYCGKIFNLTPQLKDRGDWRFRRSGLFGKEDNQEGGIPVILTLQQLDTSLGWHPITYCTAVKLIPSTAKINECETDFIVISSNRDGNVEIAISECKTNKDISEEDVTNLSKVATCLAEHKFHPFVIFSKTGTFSAEEINRCKQAGTWSNGGIILLSGRELEPYHIYERTKKEFGIENYGSSFSDMVKATNEIYFHPKVAQ
jgi:hypothetical protein